MTLHIGASVDLFLRAPFCGGGGGFDWPNTPSTLELQDRITLGSVGRWLGFLRYHMPPVLGVLGKAVVDTRL